MPISTRAASNAGKDCATAKARQPATASDSRATSTRRGPK